jgi:hypothetical protein
MKPQTLAFGRAIALVAAIFLGVSHVPAHAQRLFKCGGSYQDKPCPNEDLQQRFSSTSGGFTVTQVNPNTDKDCAKVVAEAFPLWQRMANGESAEKLKAEVDAKPISRYDKSWMRDVLISLKQYKGTPTQVRSELETQCMNYKRNRGIPTESEIATESSLRSARTADAEARMRTTQDRVADAEERRARAADERAARADERYARAAAAAAARAKATAARQY